MKKAFLRTMGLALALTLVLGGMLPITAMGEAQYDDETAALIAYCEELDALIRHPKLYKYVSADGTTEKWMCSLEPELDGLTRTDERMEFPFYYSTFYPEVRAEDFAEYECPVEEFHIHPCGKFWYDNAKDRSLELLGMSEHRGSKKALSALKVPEHLINNPYASLKSWEPSPVVIKISEEEYRIMTDLTLIPIEFAYSDVYDYQQWHSRDNDSFSLNLLIIGVEDLDDCYLVKEKVIELDPDAVTAYYSHISEEYRYASGLMTFCPDDFIPIEQTVPKPAN